MSFNEPNQLVQSYKKLQIDEGLRKQKEEEQNRISELNDRILLLSCKAIIDEINNNSIDRDIIRNCDFYNKSLLVGSVKAKINRESIDEIKRLISVFLKHEATILGKNEYNEDIITIAVRNNNIDLVKFVLKRGAEIHSDLLEITSEPEIVNLLKKTLDKNEKIKREKEFPILAEIKKQKEILKQEKKESDSETEIEEKKFDYDNAKIIDFFEAERKMASKDHHIQFCKIDGSIVLAEDFGMKNENLPWNNRDVLISVYQKDKEIITRWKWEYKE